MKKSLFVILALSALAFTAVAATTEPVAAPATARPAASNGPVAQQTQQKVNKVKMAHRRAKANKPKAKTKVVATSPAASVSATK